MTPVPRSARGRAREVSEALRNQARGPGERSVPWPAEPQPTEVSGGELTPNGWHTLTHTDHLRYTLPKSTHSATIEFETLGITTSAPGDPRKHIFAVTDRYLGPNADYNATNATVIVLRIWTSDRGPSLAGKTRLRCIGPAYEGFQDDPRSKFQVDSEPLEWDPTQWHAFRLAWTQTEATFVRDGILVSRVTYPDRDVPFRHAFINMANYARGLHGLANVTFRNIHLDPAP